MFMNCLIIIFTWLYSPVTLFAGKLDGPLVIMVMHIKDKGSHDILNIKASDIINVTLTIQVSHEACYYEMSKCLV